MSMRLYLRSSTIHGFRYLSRGHWLSRCLWGLCVLLSFFLAFLIIRFNVISFVRQPAVITSVEYELVRRMPSLLPTLMVCPRAPDAAAVAAKLSSNPDLTSQERYGDFAYSLAKTCVKSHINERLELLFSIKPSDYSRMIEKPDYEGCWTINSGGCDLLRILGDLRMKLGNQMSYVEFVLELYLGMVEMNWYNASIPAFKSFMLEYFELPVTEVAGNQDYRRIQRQQVEFAYHYFFPVYERDAETAGGFKVLEFKGLEEYERSCGQPEKFQIGGIASYMSDRGFMASGGSALLGHATANFRLFAEGLQNYLGLNDTEQVARLINMLAYDDDQRMFRPRVGVDDPFEITCINMTGNVKKMCGEEYYGLDEDCQRYCQDLDLLTDERTDLIVELLWSGFDNDPSLGNQEIDSNLGNRIAFSTLLPSCGWGSRRSDDVVKDEGCWRRIVNDRGICFVSERGSLSSPNSFSFLLDTSAPFDLADELNDLSLSPPGWLEDRKIVTLLTERSFVRKIDVLMAQKNHFTDGHLMQEDEGGQINTGSEFVYDADASGSARYDVEVSIDSTVGVTEDLKRIQPESRGCIMSDEIELRFFPAYSEGNCMLECTWLAAAEICDCVPWMLSRHLPGFNTCEHYGNRCFKDLVDNRYKNDVCQGRMTCLPDCERTIYEATTFERGVNEKAERTDLEKKLVSDYKERKEANAAAANMSQYVQEGGFEAHYKVLPDSQYHTVRLSLPQRQVLSIIKTATMTEVDMICNVGGALGLFCGFSILSLVEFVYWVAKAVMDKMGCCTGASSSKRKRRERRKKRN